MMIVKESSCVASAVLKDVSYLFETDTTDHTTYKHLVRLERAKYR